MVIRRTPQPFPTPEQAHAELVQLDAEDTELRTQVLAIARRRQEISERRQELDRLIRRIRARFNVQNLPSPARDA